MNNEPKAKPGSRRTRVIFGNHSAVIVPLQDRDSIGKFYCDVLGGKNMKTESDRDFIRLGEDFYIVFLYGDLPEAGEFLRSGRSIWLEIKSDDVEEMKRKIIAFGVKQIELPDPHFYFQAPGGQCLKLAGIDEDLSIYEGAGEGSDVEKTKAAIKKGEKNELRNQSSGGP